MIDYIKSAKLNDCTVDELEIRFDKFPKSSKIVVAVCENCGKVRIIKKQNYTDLCFICSNKNKEHIKNRVKGHLGGERISNYELYNLYIIQEKTTIQIAKIVGVSAPTISNWLREANIEIRIEQSKNFGNPMKGSKHWNWKGGITNDPYCHLFNNIFRELIRNLYNRKCFICGKTESENGRKHSVHHVNYNKNCLCNNNCEFVPLCSSCHGKTGHNRKYWEDLIMCYLYPDRINMIDI